MKIRYVKAVKNGIDLSLNVHLLLKTAQNIKCIPLKNSGVFLPHLKISQALNILVMQVNRTKTQGKL